MHKNGVVVAGDLNCAQRDMDIWNLERPAILKDAGTTLEERASFKKHFLDKGLRDSFADAHPSETGWFTYWSVRARNRPMNRGLRLDYVLTDCKAEILDTFILHEFAENGDHCPVGITLNVSKNLV
jgi:exodeoxyribonuclease III